MAAELGARASSVAVRRGKRKGAAILRDCMLGFGRGHAPSAPIRKLTSALDEWLGWPHAGGISGGERGAALELDQIRPNVFTLRATSQELSALVAAARMALDLMRGDPGAPAETLELLTRVLRDYDRALAGHEEADGRSSRPSVDSSEDGSSSR